MDAATAANNFWPPVGISQGLRVAIKLNAPLRIPNPLPPPLLIRVYVCTECNKVLVREPPPPPTMSRSLNASSKRVRFLGGYSEISLSRNVILKFLVFFLVSEKRIDRDSLGFIRKPSPLLVEFEIRAFKIHYFRRIEEFEFLIRRRLLANHRYNLLYSRSEYRSNRNKTFSLDLIYSSKWKIYFKIFNWRISNHRLLLFFRYLAFNHEDVYYSFFHFLFPRRHTRHYHKEKRFLHQFNTFSPGVENISIPSSLSPYVHHKRKENKDRIANWAKGESATGS